MKINLISKEKISITPETTEEANDVLNVVGIPVTDPRFLKILTKEITEVEDTASHDATRGGGGFGRVTITTNYLDPYWELLAERTGGKPFDLDLSGVLAGAYHTHYLEEIRYDAKTNKTTATSVLCIYPYIGETFKTEEEFQERGAQNLTRHINDKLGSTVATPEYIPLDNGLYKRNPQYGRYNPTTEPGVHNHHVWKYIVDTWVEKFATPGQKAIIENAKNNSTRLHWNEVTGRELYINNYNTHIPWEDFQRA